MGKYFGTDGVRGVAGADLTCEMAMKIGRGAAAVLTGSTGHRPRILIGKDTRQSGDMLEAALTAGLCSVGADVESLGVLPTPAVAYLVKKYNADAGVVISRSRSTLTTTVLTSRWRPEPPWAGCLSGRTVCRTMWTTCMSRSTAICPA